MKSLPDGNWDALRRRTLHHDRIFRESRREDRMAAIGRWGGYRYDPRERGFREGPRWEAIWAGRQYSKRSRIPTPVRRPWPRRQRTIRAFI